MQELVYSESPKLLRICVGIASLLPFHAGSNHARESTENTFSRAMSSYAPSIKALRCSRECVAGSARKQGRKPRLLIIRMPTNPSQTSLPGVIKEESEVQSIMKDICSVQLLPHANATELVNGLTCYLHSSDPPEFLLTQLLLTACKHPSKTELVPPRPIIGLPTDISEC